MGEKVLISGAGGFIGSHSTERLVELGFDVTAFVKYNSKNNCSCYLLEQDCRMRKRSA